MKSRTAESKTVKGFDPEAMKAPVLLRCAAFLIDYVVLIAFPIIFLVIGRLIGNDGAKLLSGELSSLGWGLALLVGAVNLVLLPLYTGQSLGKMVTGLRIVSVSGREPSLGTLFLRHTVGYLLSALSLGIGFLIAVIGGSGRGFHDRIAHTHVIFAERRVESPE